MITAVDIQKEQQLQVSLKKIQFHTQSRKTGQLGVDYIAEIIGISHEHVYHILTQELGVKKVCASWMPHFELSHFFGSRMGVIFRAHMTTFKIDCPVTNHCF